MQYLMLTNGTYERLADANAHAIKGLQPKINVWNTGAQGDGAADPTAPIRNLFQSLPPLLSTIHDQTGMSPPSWLAQMPANGAPNGAEGYDAKKVQRHLRNGSENGSA
jgi:flotillin